LILQVVGVTGGRAPRSSELLAQLRQRAQQAASAGEDSTEEVRWALFAEARMRCVRSPNGVGFSSSRLQLAAYEQLFVNK